jgi:hypothetical protein
MSNGPGGSHVRGVALLALLFALMGAASALAGSVYLTACFGGAAVLLPIEAVRRTRSARRR